VKGQRQLNEHMQITFESMPMLLKMIKLDHSCRKYSLSKLAFFWDTGYVCKM